LNNKLQLKSISRVIMSPPGRYSMMSYRNSSS
jgi:hypothetical protein